VKYKDGSIAKSTAISVSVDGGGVASGVTDSQGYVSINTSGSNGKIIINGRTVHQGSLTIGLVYI